MSLPDSWVERIWATMRATYGAAFDRQWECPAGVDPVQHVAAMKAHWARELSAYEKRPDGIRYALENLPDRPPNLVEFRKACNSRPDYVQKQLPAPTADPARVREILAGLKTSLLRHPSCAPRDMLAQRLRARMQAGEKLTMFQRDFIRASERGHQEIAE